MATTDRAYYIVTWRPEYVELLGEAAGTPERIVVSLAQGGFAEGVVDPLRQVKERFLEVEFGYQGIELDRTAEVFDEYFTLEEPDQVLDLDAGDSG
jgi:hypothetical protein